MARETQLLSPDDLAAARLVRDALSAALDQVEAGRVNADELPAVRLPFVSAVQHELTLSPDVAGIVAECKAAREDLQAETERARIVAVILQIGSMLAPLVSPLSRLLPALKVLLIGAMLLLQKHALWCLVPVAWCLFAGCAPPQVFGKADVNVPVNAPVTAPVTVAAPKVDADVDVPVQANVGLVQASLGASAPTSQPASTDAAQTAGGDARQNTVTVNVSGSAWALVGLAGVFAVALVLWLRSSGKLKEARQAARQATAIEKTAMGALSLSESGLTAVAKAIKEIGPGPVRDCLLAKVAGGLDDVSRHSLDRFLWDRGLYVGRADQAAGNEVPGAAGAATQPAAS
ncbi:MAG TPA: hypothetical protein VMY35_02530 [Phycisphaerae bacterium]|nr:hypothetical protein [Phycisphaerae bacterium]